MVAWRSVLYLPEAREDLFVIWEYLVEQTKNPAIVDRVIEKIDQTAQTYAGQPEIGELRPDLADTVRCFPVDRHVVFYVPIDGGIEIVQIIHGSRDIPRHFRRQ